MVYSHTFSMKIDENQLKDMVVNYLIMQDQITERERPCLEAVRIDHGCLLADFTVKTTPI